MFSYPTLRRTFLRSTGVVLALPILESMQRGVTANFSESLPRSFVAMNFALGIHGPNFFPERDGNEFLTTPYLEAIGEDLRKKMTVISGTSHPDVTLGHASDSTFLTAARFPGAATFRNSISLDQFLVEKLRPDTRFPSLSLGTRSGTISFSRTGTAIPLETRPSALYAKMFINGSKSQVAAQLQQLKEGQSVLDAVLIPAKKLNAELTAPDRDRMDQYFSSIRKLESRMLSSQEWVTKAKPKIDYAAPKDVVDPNDDITRLKLMLDLVYLAIKTDSARYITLYVSGSNSVQPVPGVSIEYHSLSHHGQDPEKLTQLRIVETRQMSAVGGFLRQLMTSDEFGGKLLDRTAVLIGSAMGNASSHNCTNLPIILAGGKFQHGAHLRFDKVNNMPLCRLYVSILQSMQVETDRFGSGIGTLPQLQIA